MEIKPVYTSVNYNIGDYTHVDCGIYVNSYPTSGRANVLAGDCFEEIYGKTVGGVQRRVVHKSSFPGLQSYDIVADFSLEQAPIIGYINGGDSTDYYVTEISYSDINFLFGRDGRSTFYSYNTSGGGNQITFYSCSGYPAYIKGNQRSTPSYMKLAIRLPKAYYDQYVYMISLSGDFEPLREFHAEFNGYNAIMDGASSGVNYDECDPSYNYYANYAMGPDDDPEYVYSNVYGKYNYDSDLGEYQGHGADPKVLNYTSGTTKYVLKHPNEMTLKETIIYYQPTKTGNGGIYFCMTESQVTAIPAPTRSGDPVKAILFNTNYLRYKVCSRNYNESGVIPSSGSTCITNEYLSCNMSGGTASTSYRIYHQGGPGVIKEGTETPLLTN